MEIKVNITKKYFFSILALLLVIAGLLGVIAYQSGQTPSVVGHSSEEIEVNISGTMMSLKDAVNQGKIGGPDYDSGWVSSWVWGGQSSRITNVNHGLGQTPSRFLVYVKAKNTGNGGQNVGDVFMIVDNQWYHDGVLKWRGTTVFANGTVVGVQKWQDYATLINNAGYMHIDPADFSIRYMAWK